MTDRPPVERACCYPDCDQPAEWAIWVPNEHPAEMTDSCSEHLGAMMTDAREHRVYSIPEEG